VDICKLKYSCMVMLLFLIYVCIFSLCFLVLVSLCVMYSEAKDKFPLVDNKGTKLN